MDFAKAETSWPQMKNPDQSPSLSAFIQKFVTDENAATEYLNSLIENSKIQAKTLLYDTLLIKCKSKISGVKNQNVEDFNKLLQSIVDLIWYISPHSEKLKSRGAPLPTFFHSLILFNDPKRHKHKVKQIYHNVLLTLTSSVTNMLEKSFINRKSFQFLHDVFDKLIEATVKYTDYLEANLDSVTNYQSRDEISHPEKVEILPFINDLCTSKYSDKDKAIITDITDTILEKDFYDPLLLTDILPTSPARRYKFLKNFKIHGLTVPNIVMYTRLYGPAAGGSFIFLWKEDTENRETQRQLVINNINETLPKYASRHHKKQAKKLLSLIMEDRISPASFRAIYRELTGDISVTDNSTSKEQDERIKVILNTCDESVLRDLRVKNHRKSSFDAFWDIAEKVIEKLQATAVNDRRHAQSTKDGDVVVNMSLAVSARHLYELCVKEAKSCDIVEENIPSLSWFRFQFWPKSSYVNSALNYTGRLKIRYMVQQRNIRKYSPDDHYCAALYKYARSIAIRFNEYSSFISTDDKCKIKVGEPNFPISAVTRGKQVLVAKGTVCQAADHDMSAITLVPTVVLVHDIPTDIDESWYRGTPHVFLKITATEPSSALRNAVEVENVLLAKYGTKENIPPIIIIYTDGGPEHRTNFLSVKIAMIALQKSINADLLIAVRTAPGHSYRNPVEKVNCILNLGLYGIGVMRKSIYQDQVFEKNLHQCSNVNEVRSLLDKNPTYEELLKKSCEPCIELMKETFTALSLKENKIVTMDTVLDCKVNDMVKSIDLDHSLTGSETLELLKDRPKLKKYLEHCSKERTYFFSLKKCGKNDCTTCAPIRLPSDIFESIHHLPDPMPDSNNEGHYLQFTDVYGTQTSEEHLPSLQVSSRGHRIPFNPLIQHAKNTGITVSCVECNKPRLVYARKKVPTNIIKQFKHEISELWFTCGATIEELVGKETAYDILFIRANNTCQKPVESIYYSANYSMCCCHCGSTRRLVTSTDAFPMCSTCKNIKKKDLVMKRKQNKVKK